MHPLPDLCGRPPHIRSHVLQRRCRCHPVRELVSPRGGITPRPTSQTCSPAPGHSDIQYGAHSGSGPDKRRGRLGGAPRIPTVTVQSGGRDCGSGSAMEAFWKHSTLAPEIRVRTCAHLLWYCPPLDSAGIPFFFSFPVPFLVLYPPSPLLTNCPVSHRRPAPLWLEFLTCPSLGHFPPPNQNKLSELLDTQAT